jgi:hypothetical protein
MVIYGGRRSASIDSADHHLHPHTQSTKTTLTFHKTNMIHQLFWESLTKLFRKAPLLCVTNCPQRFRVRPRVLTTIQPKSHHLPHTRTPTHAFRSTSVNVEC